MITSWPRSWRDPTSKSLGSWDGVIFTAPEPKSISTYSSAIIGIFLLPITGIITYWPTRSVYLSSAGFTAMARSPGIVSGLVVAISIPPSLSAKGYLKYQIFESVSMCSTSASEIEVSQDGHQLIILLPR